MKKLALTNLMLLMAIKSVSACSVGIDPDNPNFEPAAENFSFTKIYFYSLVFLILANIALFFLRKQKDYLVLLIIIAIVLLMLPVTFFGGIMQDCGGFIGFILKWEFFIFLIIFSFHICLWLNKIGLHLDGMRGKHQ